MEISFILRPFLNEKSLTRFINMLVSAYELRWQIILFAPEDGEETVFPQENVTVVRCSREQYIFKALENVCYDRLIIASADDSYTFDVYDEGTEKDIAVLNCEINGGYLSDECANDIVLWLLSRCEPLGGCIFRTVFLKSRLCSDFLWDDISENLLLSQLLASEDTVALDKRICMTEVSTEKAEYSHEDIIAHSDLICSRLSDADEIRMLYMTADFFLPIFRRSENRELTRWEFDFIKSYIDTISHSEDGKALIAQILQSSVIHAADMGYRFFNMFIAEQNHFYTENRKYLKNELNNTYGRNHSEILKTEKSIKNTLRSYGQILEQISKTAAKIKKAQENSLIAFNSVFSRPDLYTLSDNIFYLSELLSDIYEQCGKIELLSGKGEESK